MKKLLVLSASALALGLGAGAAMADEAPANAIKLTLGGGAIENFGYVDNPGGKNNAGLVGGYTHVLSFGDAWLTFDGKGKLDNGIGVEVNMQLNASSGSEGGNGVGNTRGTEQNKTIVNNEADWIAFDGAFGRVEVGDDFNPAAAYRFGNGSPYYGNSGTDWPRYTGWIVGAGPLPATVGNQQFAMMDDYEATKIIYQTPVFSGFQISGSYTPSISAADSYNNLAGKTGAIANGGGGGDQYIAVASYKNTFGDVSLNGDVDYGYEDLFNQNAVSGGLNIGFKGFTLGGAAIDRWVNNSTGVPGTVAGVANTLTYKTLAGAGVDYTVGLGYANGPWGVAFDYSHDSGYDTGATGAGGAVVSGNATLTVYNLTAKYTLGPGVDVNAEGGLLYYRVPDGASADQVDGAFALVGTSLTF